MRAAKPEPPMPLTIDEVGGRGHERARSRGDDEATARPSDCRVSRAAASATWPGLERRRPRATCARAVEALREHGVEVEAASSLYETEPVGEILDQPDFLNAAVRIRTELEPRSCSTPARRSRSSRAGVRRPAPRPRPLDLDLLLLGDVELETSALTLPHPEVTSRRFVLDPLLELEPELALPDGTRLAAALSELGEGQRASSGPPRNRALSLRPRGCARSGSSHAAGSTGGARPGTRGPAGAPARPRGGLRSPAAGPRRVIARRRLAAIWRSAAVGWSPPSTPSAIQPSTRCELRPGGGQVGPDTARRWPR